MYKTYKTRPEIMQDITGDGATALCTAILAQAVLDYQDLNERGVASRKDKKNGNYSKSEIAKFLKSDWCGYLLKSIGGNFTGEYILSCLRAQKQKN